MADSTNASPAGEGPGPAARTLRATALSVAEAYRQFIAHAQDCDTCRTTGADCEGAVSLKQIWRDAREAAAH